MEFALRLLAIQILLASCLQAGDRDWLQFRGPGAVSSVPSAKLPTEWSVESGENISWTASLPGQGCSSPIVVDGRVFVTCSSGADQDRLHVIAFSAETGDQLWHRRFWATGRTLCHPTSSVAAPTPTSDGESVFAFYSSNDLFCLDLDGNVQWIRGLGLDHPLAGNDIGMSSSPVVADGAVVVQSEAQGESFLEAIEIDSGSTRWQVDRPQKANWCSPTVIELADQSYVVTKCAAGVDVYRADNGKLHGKWESECDVIPSVAYQESLIVPANGITLLSLDTNGEISYQWQENRVGVGTPSPVIHNGLVIGLKGALLTCANLETRKIAWKKRLAGQFWATPVAAANLLYCFNRDGKAFVVDLNAKGKIVWETDMAESFSASPSVAGSAMYVRSDRHLWRISESKRSLAAAE